MGALRLAVFLGKPNLVVAEYLPVEQSRIVGCENQLALHVLVIDNTRNQRPYQRRMQAAIQLVNDVGAGLALDILHHRHEVEDALGAVRLFLQFKVIEAVVYLMGLSLTFL